jgi:hypothetical protein
MRKMIVTAAAIAAAALAVSACKRQATVTNISNSDLGANMMTTAPGNDASAMESVTNSARTPPPPPPVTSNSAANTSSSAAPPRTNNVESNTLGM